MATSSKPRLPVLIVGAGPTGLTLALELALQEVPFRIVDALPVRSDKSRALVVHPRTLELLRRHRYGSGNNSNHNGEEDDVGTRIRNAGVSGLGVVMYAGRRRAASVSIGDVDFDDTAFPLPVWLSQEETEGILADALASAAPGVVVERGVRVEKIEQRLEGDGASACLVRAADDGGAEELLQAEYIVGCDGAHSAVRHAACLKYEGARYPQHYILCDAVLEASSGGEGYDGQALSFFLGRRMLVMFPLKDGKVRLISQRLDDDPHEPTLDEFQALLEEMAPAGWTLKGPAVWLAQFQFHHRGVDAYRRGRLFVAGDAAHIHSPAGGQGMNTGIQDAVNLGWKLGAAYRAKDDGPNKERLLDSYDAERKPVGDNLLQGTDRIFRFMSSVNPVFTALRTFLAPRVLPWLAASKERRARGYRFMSELGIRYRQSPVVGTDSTFGGPVRGGWRAPDGVVLVDGDEKWLHSLCSPLQYTLLIFEGTDEGRVLNMVFVNSLQDELRVPQGLEKVYTVTLFVKAAPSGNCNCLDKDKMLHSRYGMKGPGYALIRPDLYIAHVGTLEQVGKFMGWYAAQHLAGWESSLHTE